MFVFNECINCAHEPYFMFTCIFIDNNFEPEKEQCKLASKETSDRCMRGPYHKQQDLNVCIMIMRGKKLHVVLPSFTKKKKKKKKKCFL